jgi:FkbM family methyltransferase
MIRALKSIIKSHPLAARLCRRLLDERNFRQKPVRTPLGFLFTGDRGMMDGCFETEETAFVREHLRDAEVFINIGANIGYYSCLALQENKRAVAVEPMPRNLRCLYHNIALNDWQERVEVFPLALGAKPGLMEIYGGGTTASLVKGWSGTPEGYRQRIPVSTVDHLFSHRFTGKRCLLLVDVEGAELELLRGAVAFLKHSAQATWIVEISVDEHLPGGQRVNPNLLATFQMFWDHGYQAATATAESREVTREEVTRIAEGGENTLGTHNFVFRPGFEAGGGRP